MQQDINIVPRWVRNDGTEVVRLIPNPKTYPYLDLMKVQRPIEISIQPNKVGWVSCWGEHVIIVTGSTKPIPLTVGFKMEEVQELHMKSKYGTQNKFKIHTV